MHEMAETTETSDIPRTTEPLTNEEEEDLEDLADLVAQVALVDLTRVVFEVDSAVVADGKGGASISNGKEGNIPNRTPAPAKSQY